MYEPTIHATGIIRISIFGLLRESIGIEPRQQLEIKRQTHITVLRGMDVQVIESRDKNLISEIHHLATPIHIFRQLGIDTFYQTVRPYDDIAVRNDFQLPGCRGVDNVRSVDFHLF